MILNAAFFLFCILPVSFGSIEHSTCEDSTICTCGVESGGRNVTICLEAYKENDPCSQFSSCNKCQDRYRLTACSQCFPEPECNGDCGTTFVEASGKAINSTQTELGDWPWVVAIRSDPDSPIICAGVLLDPRTVVTAAHCLTRYDSYTLYFGKLYRRNSKDDAEVQVRNSTKIILHPDFETDFEISDFDSDIALILFEPSVQFSERIQPICLPTPRTTTRNVMRGGTGVVVGWGISTVSQLPSEILLRANFRVRSNRDCVESFQRVGHTFMYLTQNQFCAGNEDGRGSPCITAGGGGTPMFFYDNQRDRYTLEGLISFGLRGQCEQPGRYNVFTFVYKFIPWIDCQMNEGTCVVES